MKLLLLGATGRTGKWVLKYALEKGNEVNCLVRKPEKLEQKPGLHILKGNPGNYDDLEEAIAGCSSVLSVLNISRHSDFPWAKLRTPETFLSTVMTHLISIASKSEIRRVVLCSAWGVRETRKDLPFWFRWMIDYSNIGVAYRDHERQEKLLEASTLDWTIVRPVGLTNVVKPQEVQESYENFPKPGLLISRGAVGRYMVDCLEAEDMFYKKVVVSKG